MEFRNYMRHIDSLSALICEVSRNFWHAETYERRAGSARSRRTYDEEITRVRRARAPGLSRSFVYPPSGQPPRRLSVQAPAVFIERPPGDSRWRELRNRRLTGLAPISRITHSRTLTTLLFSRRTTGTDTRRENTRRRNTRNRRAIRGEHVAKCMLREATRISVSVALYVRRDTFR